MKKELNDQFRQTHPDIDPSMSLSKLRKLKTALLKIAEACSIDLSTVAKAFVLFEKLVLRVLVNKVNRKLIGGCCLLLAVKANGDPSEVSLDLLFQSINEVLEVTRKDLLAAEFAVFAALEFELIPPQNEYLPHLDRILTALDYSNIQEYLGERMYTLWKR